MFRLEFEGIPQLAQALQRLASQAQAVMVQAVTDEAARILDASFPLVPVDTGLLLTTGMVERETDGATVRYGGHGLAPYALVVHEDVTMNHPNGGQAKFLQQPFLAALDGMPGRVGADVHARVRG